MWKTAERRRRERAAYGRWRDRERLGRSLPACCRPATIPSNSPTERQRTTYDAQSPSALVERILETYLSLLQHTQDTQIPTIIGPLRAVSDPSEGRQRA